MTKSKSTESNVLKELKMERFRNNSINIPLSFVKSKVAGYYCD
ncbi:protein of unknown function [Candidatus Nitrosocosmicus franklandus]|uniref:Uncharacterized protein n=1 Tax=Candidatus Nitrosocosmicus franklandianus TaxID=1798806 RepID=A0A484I7N5_9ARCH|nr:protein of unknown function [Candidatus Nitrosocosmicus franklandus]